MIGGLVALIPPRLLHAARSITYTTRSTLMAPSAAKSYTTLHWAAARRCTCARTTYICARAAQLSFLPCCRAMRRRVPQSAPCAPFLRHRIQIRPPERPLFPSSFGRRPVLRCTASPWRMESRNFSTSAPSRDSLQAPASGGHFQL